jgi:hypothetical protein
LVNSAKFAGQSFITNRTGVRPNRDIPNILRASGSRSGAHLSTHALPSVHDPDHPTTAPSLCLPASRAHPLRSPRTRSTLPTPQNGAQTPSQPPVPIPSGPPSDMRAHARTGVMRRTRRRAQAGPSAHARMSRYVARVSQTGTRHDIVLFHVTAMSTRVDSHTGTFSPPELHNPRSDALAPCASTSPISAPRACAPHLRAYNRRSGR